MSTTDTTMTGLPGQVPQKANGEKGLIWFSRILRWSLGSMFISAGIYYFRDGAWPAIFFGAVLLVTGFFRPRRCIDDNCEIPR